jgi:ABC-type transport system involved in cytochrome c biogenesis permease subunit
MQSILFWAAVTLYAVATVLYFLWAGFKRERFASLARLAGIAALAPHAASLALRWAEVGHGPYNTRYEVLSANTFLLVLVWAAAGLFAPGLRSLGAFVMPAAFLAMGWSVATFEVRAEVPIIFKSYWLALHIGFAKLFAATILLAGACSGAYLAKKRRPESLSSLPTPERLDLYGHQFTLVSFLFLGVMIVAGALWAKESWGRYWAWDPMETSSLVTWLVFGVILHFRVLQRWSGTRMAWLTFVGLAFAIATVYVVAIVVPTIHNSYMVAKP